MTVIARDDVTLALVTDVASTAHYFQLKASTASAPSAPTAYPAPSPWVTTEPTYTEGATNSLYTVDVTVFSDGSFDYTPVSLSSSYEAAKAAYNKAQQAQSSAASAQSAATTAQTTADGKNKIFSSAIEPSHTGIVPGDLWFQLDSNQNVTGIQVWNGSTFTDMVLLANKLLVASSVGTTQIADNAIVTGKIAANAVTAIQIAAQSITGDKLDVGSVAAAIVTSGKFQTATSGARVVMDSNGIRAYDAAGNTTFQIEAATGKAILVGGMQTALSGKRISISQSGDVGKVSLLDGNSELTSLTFIDDTDSSGYLYTGLYTGQNGQFLQFATLVDPVNHTPDPLQDDASLISNGRMGIEAPYGIKVNGTWFARSVDDLPTIPRVVGDAGTMAVVGGVDYVFDGAGLWVCQTQQHWIVCDTGTIGYYVPQASGTVRALSVCKQHGIVELMGRIAVGGAVAQNSDMGAMIPDGYRPTTTTMIQSDQTSWGHFGPPFLARPDGHIIWGPSMSAASDAIFHGMWVCA